jgi:hypothetical protein
MKSVNTNILKPPLNTPVLDKNTGMFDYAWQSWFDKLSTQGTTSSSINALIDSINSSIKTSNAQGTGFQGTKPVAGFNGINGMTGAAGPQGATGPVGPTGPQGDGIYLKPLISSIMIYG